MADEFNLDEIKKAAASTAETYSHFFPHNPGRFLDVYSAGIVPEIPDLSAHHVKNHRDELLQKLKGKNPQEAADILVEEANFCYNHHHPHYVQK